ncbi:MAG TPA: TetR family transcriptional regulator [Mycobacteriales bacterium]|nr:TetR family transcriptional regulator [Mycobacteriales bacterium]
MAASSARVIATTPATVAGSRLNRSDRRDHLLDAAAVLAAREGVDAVSMEAVADAAGVSRALVYKHFENRIELLGELRRREALALHLELAQQVQAETTVEGMFRALIHASLRASEQRGALFAALRSASGYNKSVDREQSKRDRRTMQFFAERAAAEYDVPQQEAEAAVGMLLGAIDAVLAQWRAKRTTANASLLEETYLTLVHGGLSALAERAPR